ncbi:MAG TPA: branched-chain amino acid ABC transporter permease [Burkholderiales bacterium]|jgi:branched-chain amino acid transport system permease protein|nr:branched-chain amino acid ABC transporter permease [Burkholderiales bacterium]
MNSRKRDIAIMVATGVAGIAAPWVAPAITTQMAFLWLMILFALTWDINGGQMGYNSFGNVLFFGLGVYACALLQRDSGLSYYVALGCGIGLGALVAAGAALILGPAVLAIRGHYFAIATLGLAIVAADIASAWEYVGAASGLATPVYPGLIEHRTRFFYYLLFVLAALTFLTVRKLYSARFGLAINAIRDDEDKAEAMGLHTTRYKVFAWCISAFFLGAAGGPVGNLVGFIDPQDLAFAGATFGVWMVLMAVLGGKGTLWGPVIGAVVFHITQEVFWTYLLGWQRVAMGLLIVIIVVFFPAGILGWAGRARARPKDPAQPAPAAKTAPRPSMEAER